MFSLLSPDFLKRHNIFRTIWLFFYLYRNCLW